MTSNGGMVLQCYTEIEQYLLKLQGWIAHPVALVLVGNHWYALMSCTTVIGTSQLGPLDVLAIDVDQLSLYKNKLI